MKQESNMQLTSRLLFRLLPVQFFLALVSSVNGIVSGLFATNCIGVDAMTAIGLYNPFNMFTGAISLMMVGGATILCGKYIGRNETDKVQDVLSLSNTLCVLIAGIFIVLYLFLAIFDLTGFIARDPAVRPLFNHYLVGQSFGVMPLFLGNQLASFLSLENQAKRTTFASLVYLAVNVFLNYLFLIVLNVEKKEFALALASSIGLWVFFLLQTPYFFKKDVGLRLFKSGFSWRMSKDIVKIGIPGAASNGYQTLRSLIVNNLLTTVLASSGSAALSAFTASDTLLRFAWALPTGMLAVSRMLISISIGEEDRQTLTDVMRNMFRRFLPLMSVICLAIILLAKPLAGLFYRSYDLPVYDMTVWGFRILPVCMPLSIICMHFVCYAQASNKQVLVHILSLLDGVVCVAGFTALLIRSVGMNSVYIANVLNGVVTTIVIVMYAAIRNKKMPGSMDELMVVPEDFGVSEDARMDLSVRSVQDVVTVSERVQKFCTERGIDGKRSYFAALFLEEMAGNVVEHWFSKDHKPHSIDIRVVHKDDSVILRIKDDCIGFNPKNRSTVSDPDDPAKNIGIRMIYQMSEKIEYQNILGLNVLTARI